MSNVKPKLGYIGMGIMGAPMASNLIKAGCPMVVWNRTPRKCDPLRELGAEVADAPADVAARGAEVIFLNLTDTPDVEAVLFGKEGGDDGVASKAKPGTIIVDNSTISPDATRAFAAKLAECDVHLVDAPVSGGDTGAKAGTLSIMVGGADQAVAKVMPLLEVVGKKIVHLGGPGMGQACKACNQIAVVNALLGVCEALALAKKTGLDPRKMIEVVSGGAGGSWQLANLGPKIIQGDHAPGFMIDLILKDLGIVLDTAERAGLPLSGTAISADYYQSVQDSGGGKLGTQAIAKVLESLGDFTFVE